MAKVERRQASIGILTWPQLGGVQIRLAKSLNVSYETASFVAGAIQYLHTTTFASSCLSAEYLDEEPSMLAIDDAEPLTRQSMQDDSVPLWQLHE